MCVEVARLVGKWTTVRLAWDMELKNRRRGLYGTYLTAVTVTQQWHRKEVCIFSNGSHAAKGLNESTLCIYVAQNRMELQCRPQY